MTLRRINWPLWSGFLVTLVAFLSYGSVFVWFPATRDFPWANLLLFAVGAILLFIGVRRAFKGERPHPKRAKITASVVATLALAIFVFFAVATFIIARNLPASAGAPQVGEKARPFSLLDTNGKTVSVSELLASPINGKTPRGVLLIFYRGYW